MEELSGEEVTLEPNNSETPGLSIIPVCSGVQNFDDDSSSLLSVKEEQEEVNIEQASLLQDEDECVKNEGEMEEKVGESEGSDEEDTDGEESDAREKTLACPFCLKAFQKKSRFKEHVRNHTGEKPFQCQDCEEFFTTDRQLKEHIKEEHICIKVVKEEDECDDEEPPCKRATAETDFRCTVPRPYILYDYVCNWRSFNETDKDFDSFEPLCFYPSRPPGPALNVSLPLQIFQKFFSKNVVNNIISNTNRNAPERLEFDKRQAWTPLTLSEFYAFVAILIYMGLCKIQERSDYWSQTFPYNHPFPRNFMTHKRFEAILSVLHLSNTKQDKMNEQRKGSLIYNPLFKLRPLYTELKHACMANFHPDRNLCIGEQLVSSREESNGLKLFVVADSATGYTWNFEIFPETDSLSSNHAIAYSSVMDLLCFPCLGTGYNVYTSSFFTSTRLFLELFQRKITACGIIDKNGVGFPLATNDQDDESKTAADGGRVRWMRKTELLFVKCKNKKEEEVVLCSSFHKFDGQEGKEPGLVSDYNKYMRGIKLSNDLIRAYKVLPKSVPWFTTFFCHFLDIAVVNSHILYLEVRKKKDSRLENLPSQKQFREFLCGELVKFGQNSCDDGLSCPTTCLPEFFDENLFQKFCRRCFLTEDKKVQTTAFCRKCLVPLCLTPTRNCFTAWHRQKNRK